LVVAVVDHLAEEAEEQNQEEEAGHLQSEVVEVEDFHHTVPKEH